MGILGLGRIGEHTVSETLHTTCTSTSAHHQSVLSVSLIVLVLSGVAIAERLAPFKVKKFIYTDVVPRPELASVINAEYGKDCRSVVTMFHAFHSEI